ncbi:MAG: glycosyltransferase family 2 protein [Chloroflexi bacterium]|nr:glycosyltransferase family 2 protein [Chloroflexota bacterium]MBI3733730.1 glycosyltransferase family 2 protein [Chloroflexota bacterium]
MARLSVVILTLNEEKHLADCLASVGTNDEVLVVDSGSTDRTWVIAHDAGARVEVRPFENFADQRNAALGMARGDWVLFVDADERLTPELRMEISQLLAGDPVAAGFRIPRQNYIFGAWVKHTGWYPDYQLRLMRRGAARYDPARPVHETVVLDGDADTLKGHLTHINYESLSEFVRKQKIYAQIEAEGLVGRSAHRRLRSVVFQPLREFYRRYVSLSGFRDGWRGLVLSVLMAWYTLEVHRVAWQTKRADQPT